MGGPVEKMGGGRREGRMKMRGGRGEGRMKMRGGRGEGRMKMRCKKGWNSGYKRGSGGRVQVS